MKNKKNVVRVQSVSSTRPQKNLEEFSGIATLDVSSWQKIISVGLLVVFSLVGNIFIIASVERQTHKKFLYTLLYYILTNLKLSMTDI